MRKCLKASDHGCVVSKSRKHDDAFPNDGPYSRRGKGEFGVTVTNDVNRDDEDAENTSLLVRDFSFVVVVCFYIRCDSPYCDAVSQPSKLGHDETSIDTCSTTDMFAKEKEDNTARGKNKSKGNTKNNYTQKAKKKTKQVVASPADSAPLCSYQQNNLEMIKQRNEEWQQTKKSVCAAAVVVSTICFVILCCYVNFLLT